MYVVIIQPSPDYRHGQLVVCRGDRAEAEAVADVFDRLDGVELVYCGPEV